MYPQADIAMTFFSTEEVIAALDENGLDMGGEADELSLHSFEDDPHAAVASEVEQLKTASKEEEAEQAHEGHSQEEDEQPYTPSEDPSLEEAEEPHTDSEGPSPEGQTSAHEGLGTSGEGMYTPGEESSQEESSSSDVDSNDEEAPKKKATRKRRKRPDVWQKNKRKRRNLGRKYVSTSKKVVSGVATQYLHVKPDHSSGATTYSKHQAWSYESD